MSIEPYRTGKAGRPVRAITMEDRLRRYRVMQKVEAAFEDGKPNMERRMKAGGWLWEADVQRTLIVRWLPPDPNDRSRFIEPEPD